MDNTFTDNFCEAWLAGLDQNQQSGSAIFQALGCVYDQLYVTCTSTCTNQRVKNDCGSVISSSFLHFKMVTFRQKLLIHRYGKVIWSVQWNGGAKLMYLVTQPHGRFNMNQILL